jgi:hypothetical protein
LKKIFQELHAIDANKTEETISDNKQINGKVDHPLFC